MKSAFSRLAVAILVLGSPAFAWAADAAPAVSPPPSPSAGCGKALAADVTAGKTTTHSFTSGGSSRSYLLHVPANYDPAKPVPLLLNFHGFMSNPEKQNAATAFEALSDREGFILVAPDGGIGWRFAQSARDANTAFVRDVIANASGDLCVDGKRIFAAGKSQGGFMSSWFACAAPDVLAAIAPVSGMYEPTGSCHAIPIMEFHGTADTMIPFGGGHVLVLGDYPGAVPVMEKWAQLNQCSGTPETTQVTPHVKRVTYAGCAATTIQYITDAGHTWPGAKIREGDNSTPAELPASDLIWDFFKAHPKP